MMNKNNLTIGEAYYTAVGMKNVASIEKHLYSDVQLKGDLKGFYSVQVNGNWRIIFRFENGEANDVDLIDYH